MSWQARWLNVWLRHVEKPRIQKATDTAAFRRRFERMARLFFHGARAVRMSETEIAGRPALSLTAPDAARLILYFHGGGYIFGSPRTHAAMLSQIALRADCDVVLPDYRKAPEYPFPAALDDALDAYRALLDAGRQPGSILLGGDSAGGGLALAVLGRILALGLPHPAGLFAFSPLVDFTFSGASFRQNAGHDVLLPAARAAEMRDMYLGQHDPTDPGASPLFADFAGVPPVWLTSGRTEILRDDALRLTDRLQQAGAAVTHDARGDLPHVWPILHNYLPEARRSLAELADWIKALPSAPADS